MAKNLTEVIRSMEKDQRKELHFTLHKGKVAIIFNTIIFTSAVTYFFLGALKSRSSYTLLDIDLYLVLSKGSLQKKNKKNCNKCYIGSDPHPPYCNEKYNVFFFRN